MENSNRLIEEFDKIFPFGLQEQIGTGFNDCTPKVRAFLEKVRQETLKEVGEKIIKRINVYSPLSVHDNTIGPLISGMNEVLAIINQLEKE